MDARHRSVARLLLPFVVAAGVAVNVNACSGKTTSDTSTSGSAGGDSGTTQNNPTCPDTDPGEGAACTKDGVQCEYGTDFNPLCNRVWLCSSGHWGPPIRSGGPTKCPSSPPTVAINPPECASARATVPQGEACSSPGDAGGLTCSYDGSTCTCGSFCPSYPVGQRDCDADAGITESCCDRSKNTWHCFDGPAFCKVPRPRVGSACTTEGESCALSAPAECGQSVLKCQNGVWDAPSFGCPISSARAKREIAYVAPEDTARLHEELMSTRLATYRYKAPAPDGMGGSDARHLGFIIEDMPEGSAAVLPSRERVDLYGYTSMTVASLQHQQREIDELKAEMVKLRKENAALKDRKR